MLELVKKIFAQELLSISANAVDMVEFVWALYKIGGVVPVSVLSGHFPGADKYVDILGKAGMIRYSLGGFVKKDFRKESVMIFLDEDFLRSMPGDMKKSELSMLIFRRYGEKIIPHCSSDLIGPLAIMLTSIIFYATPERSVFANRVIRRAEKSSMRKYMDCRNILEYYLHKYLGLVTLEGGSLVNLSVRSRQRIRAYPKLWETYARAYEEKEKEESVPEERKPLSRPPEYERRLKSYFPWMA